MLQFGMGVLRYSCMQALKLQHPKKHKRKEVKIIIILVLHDVFPCNIAMHGMQPLHAVHAVAFLSLSSVKSMLLQTFLQKLQTLHLHLQEKYRQQQEQQEELGCHIIMIPFCLAT